MSGSEHPAVIVAARSMRTPRKPPGSADNASVSDIELRMALLEEAFKDLTFLVRDHLWTHEQEKQEPLTKDDPP